MGQSPATKKIYKVFAGPSLPWATNEPQSSRGIYPREENHLYSETCHSPDIQAVPNPKMPNPFPPKFLARRCCIPLLNRNRRTRTLRPLPKAAGSLLRRTWRRRLEFAAGIEKRRRGFPAQCGENWVWPSILSGNIRQSRRRGQPFPECRRSLAKVCPWIWAS